MFDLITGSAERPLRERAPGSKVVSIILHIVVLTLVLGIPLLTATNTLPNVPTMMAFVTAAPAATPPPPPPPPPPARAAGAVKPTPPAPKDASTAAPIDAPPQMKVEASSDTSTAPGGGSAVGGVEGGVAGGIEGGVVGGVLGGVVGSIASSMPPPPPPPPAGPVRVGGQIKTPDLTHRVEPVYPDLAAAAHITGVVILEASVGTDGNVKSVKLLKSSHALLDRSATEALKQWQYSPLILNGIPTPFVLTVTFTFSASR